MDRDYMESYFKYLDDLRESGTTNMFGAAPYLMRRFGLGKSEARTVLMQWMSSYEERDSAKQHK